MSNYFAKYLLHIFRTSPLRITSLSKSQTVVSRRNINHENVTFSHRHVTNFPPGKANENSRHYIHHTIRGTFSGCDTTRTTIFHLRLVPPRRRPGLPFVGAPSAGDFCVTWPAPRAETGVRAPLCAIRFSRRESSLRFFQPGQRLIENGMRLPHSCNCVKMKTC